MGEDVGNNWEEKTEGKLQTKKILKACTIKLLMIFNTWPSVCCSDLQNILIRNQYQNRKKIPEYICKSAQYLCGRLVLRNCDNWAPISAIFFRGWWVLLNFSKSIMYYCCCLLYLLPGSLSCHVFLFVYIKHLRTWSRNFKLIWYHVLSHYLFALAHPLIAVEKWAESGVCNG